MTLGEFEEYYARNSRMTVEQLHNDMNMRAKPCHCDSEDCRGWQMVHLEKDGMFPEMPWDKEG